MARDEPVGTEPVDMEGAVIKRALRLAIRGQLAGLTVEPERMRAAAAAAAALLAGQAEYARARTVLIFLSAADEIDTQPLAQRAWQDGKRVLAPQVDWERRELRPVEIRSFEDDVQPGRHGIRAPLDALGPPVAAGEIDLVLTPGLAFDAAGGRLGRGAGFYDRFLSRTGLQAVACGYAFEEQVVAAVPMEAHDVPMAMLVTEARVRRFGAGTSASASTGGGGSPA